MADIHNNTNARDSVDHFVLAVRKDDDDCRHGGCSECICSLGLSSVAVPVVGILLVISKKGGNE